ncbi:unnamed protein product [Adineta ricciae]|uniref:PiggyBac transposable element-derived protein domain-containing protein n=1 Tax=Adineta ricciae TaxID=249248 RepID=A0A815MYL8_ADIRI|nr:unnamed protein product [Adineta ricciae]CAF1471156.1 unnamed protein product [Adineta ricciae]
MPTTRSSKRHSVVPNGLSEEEVQSSDSEDEIKEDVEVIKQASPPSKKTKKLDWKKKDFILPLADFTGLLPPPPDEDLQPIDYFYSMFGRESIVLLSDQSNLYSVQLDPNKPLGISQHEMEHFIGILIMTGVYSFPTPRFFWMNTTRIESIASVISRDRFLQIRKNLDVIDNSNQLFVGDPNFDRAHKVRPLLNIVKENFRKIPKEEKLSADEQIIPFKGRSIMKQHMPLKPNRWGYKMFVLAGGESGICYDFVFYTVPRGINHKLYCDNFYTTIALQVELFKLGIFTVGTVRSNRLSGLVMKTEAELSKEGRGSMDHRVVEVDGIQICATRWYDNNVVNCLSTLHACQPIDLVQRWSTKEKKHVQVTRPDVIRAYNQYMGGVDLIDMLISLYRINVKSNKYYMKIIFHLIDLSIVNAWLLYRRHCSQINIPKKTMMSLLTFRLNVAESLLKSAPLVPPVKRGRPSLKLSTVESSASTSPRAAPSPLPPKNIRFDKYDHWPIQIEKGRCRNAGCNGYTRISCSKCKLRLCLNENNNCFKDYHNE